MSRKARILVPALILLTGLAIVWGLVELRPEVATRPTRSVAPLVRVVSAEPESVQVWVRTQGTVVPRTESELVAQVAGEVVWVSPNLASGGFFDRGDPLVRIDRADAGVELQSARAAVARADSEFGRTETERERQRRLAERGVTAQARIDDAENAYRVAEAALREARARLARAERDLARTELRAPFQGRVRNKHVDVGQFVNRGATLATLYAVDEAEVRLPLPDRELRWLDLPLGYASKELGEAGPRVVLSAEFAGSRRTWEGRIVRTEGEIDPRSRMVHVVARVEDPYGREQEERAHVPLAVGLFVEAEIAGRELEEAYVLPRTALQSTVEDGDHLHVVDAEGRLHVRDVEVLRSERDRVLIGAGLQPGERVSLSALPAVVDGMRVRVVGEDSGDDAAGLAGQERDGDDAAGLAGQERDGDAAAPADVAAPGEPPSDEGSPRS